VPFPTPRRNRYNFDFLAPEKNAPRQSFHRKISPRSPGHKLTERYLRDKRLEGEGLRLEFEQNIGPGLDRREQRRRFRQQTRVEKARGRELGFIERRLPAILLGERVLVIVSAGGRPVAEPERAAPALFRCAKSSFEIDISS